MRAPKDFRSRLAILLLPWAQLLTTLACAPPPRSSQTITCEADQFLMTACNDLACISLPDACVGDQTCGCLRSNPLCDEEDCSQDELDASFALELDGECSTRPDGSLLLYVPPIDYCS